jgi:peptidylprolyl isomerase
MILPSLLLASIAVVCAQATDKPSVNLVTKGAYFDVSISNVPAGRISFGLFGDIVPKTVKNFWEISREAEEGEKKLSYKGTIFHRVIPDFMIQGGDLSSAKYET